MAFPSNTATSNSQADRIRRERQQVASALSNFKGSGGTSKTSTGSALNDLKLRARRGELTENDLKGLTEEVKNIVRPMMPQQQVGADNAAAQQAARIVAEREAAAPAANAFIAQQNQAQRERQEKAGGVGSKIGQTILGVLGGLGGGPLGAIAGREGGKVVGNLLGSQFAAQPERLIDRSPNTITNEMMTREIPLSQFGRESGGPSGAFPSSGRTNNQFAGGPMAQQAMIGDPTGMAGAQGGAGIQGGAIGGAVSSQLAGQQAAIEEQRREAELSRSQLDPYRQAGMKALEQQQALLGLGGQQRQLAAQDALQETPGQRFLRDRQEKALIRRESAGGKRMSPALLTALQQQAAGFAQQDLQNQFGRLGQLSGQGLQATTSGGQFGSGAAANIANLNVAGGEARASGILGQQQLEAQKQLGQMQKDAAKTEGIANILGLYSEDIGDLIGSAASGIGNQFGEWLG